MKYTLLLLSPLVLCAQFRVTFLGATATQAVLRLTGYAGVCTMDVRENDAAGVQHPDWTAMADSAHPLTTTNTQNEKFLVIGQRTGNKALKAGWQYYYSITGCGAASATFTTKAAVMGMISHKQPGQNLAHWRALDYPEIDWNVTGRGKEYVHPVTGIPVKLVTQPEDFSFMDSVNQTFAHVAGGTGWTAPQTISAGATSTAQTTNQNPLFLYGYGTSIHPWSTTSRSVDNIGLVVWAQCITGTGADCDLEFSLTDDPAVIPKAGTTPVVVRAGATFIQRTEGASTLSAAVGTGTAAYPPSFPRPHFSGWGSFRLDRDMYVPNTMATANFSAGAGTIANPSQTNHFPRGVKPGQHIYVQDAAANCTSHGANGICTVASITDAGSLTLVETAVTDPSTFVRPLPWGIAVRKLTGTTNAIRVGVMFRFSGHFPYSTGTNQPRCGPAEIVRSDGVTGSSCVVPHAGGFYHWYFISHDGRYIHPISGMQDGLGDIAGPPSFHHTDPRILYSYSAQGGGGLKQFTYNGNWGVSPTIWEIDPPAGARYSVQTGGAYPFATFEPSSYITSVQILSNSSMASQVASAYPDQVVAPYSPWGGNHAGVAGELAIFYRVVNGNQDNGPCQVAAFNVNTGKLVDFFNTNHSPGTPLNFSACHSVATNMALPNIIKLSFNLNGNVVAPSTSFLLYGPHQLQIEAVKRGGVMNTDTCLEWPIGTTGAGGGCANLGTTLPHYDKECPSVPTIPQQWFDQGAQPGNCMTIRVTGSTVAKAICSSKGNDAGTTTDDDFAIFGACEWNAGAEWSGGPPLDAGMKFVDIGKGGASDKGDYENFKVLTITPTGDGTSLTLQVQRAASRQKCCGVNGTVDPPAPGNDCEGNNTQLQHADNWFAEMVPGYYGSCNAPTFYVRYPDPTTKTGRIITELPQRLGEGHSTIGKATGTRLRFISGTGSQEENTLEEFGTQPPKLLFPLNTTFQGIAAPIGTYYQQYLSLTQHTVGDTWKHFTGDCNHINSGSVGQNSLTGNGLANLRPTFVGPVAGIASLWRITVANGNDIKNKPVIAWCGPKALTDISSPDTGNVIDAAPDYSYCVAYKPNQCRTGSTAGMTWTKCPQTIKHSDANVADDYQTGLEFASTPALLSAAGNGGWAIQKRTDTADVTGNNQRLVSDFFSPAGTQYPFWNATTTSGGRGMLASSGGHAGPRMVVWLALPPKMPLEHTRVSGYKRIEFKVGPRAGMTHARIKFGNNPLFQCNVHYKTECYTDNALTPYAFSDDTGRAPNACGAGGCTLVVNAWPDEPLWYQLETSTDGTVFTGDSVQVSAP